MLEVARHTCSPTYLAVSISPLLRWANLEWVQSIGVFGLCFHRRSLSLLDPPLDSPIPAFVLKAAFPLPQIHHFEASVCLVSVVFRLRQLPLLGRIVQDLVRWSLFRRCQMDLCAGTILSRMRPLRQAVCYVSKVLVAAVAAASLVPVPQLYDCQWLPLCG